MAKIFDKRTRKWREIEPKAYAEYMKYCTAFRKRQLHHGLCNCNRRMWWLCDTDCLNCEFQCEGDKTVSLDAVSFIDEHGNECSIEDCMENPSELVEELISDADELRPELDEVGDFARHCHTVTANHGATVAACQGTARKAPDASDLTVLTKNGRLGAMLEILHINTQRGASETRCAGIGYAVLHRNGREEHATVLIDLLAVGDEEEEMLGEEVSMVLFLCICVLISNPGRLSKGEVFARSIEAEHVVDAWIIRDRVLRIEREVVSVKKVNQTVSSSRNTIVNKVCHSRLYVLYV